MNEKTSSMAHHDEVDPVVPVPPRDRGYGTALAGRTEAMRTLREGDPVPRRDVPTERRGEQVARSVDGDHAQAASPPGERGKVHPRSVIGGKEEDAYEPRGQGGG